MIYEQSGLFHVKQLENWNSLGLETEIVYNDIISLNMLLELLLESDHGLLSFNFPIEIAHDQIQFGSLSNKRLSDCFIIKNTDHPNDYYNFAITSKATFDTTLINIYRIGKQPASENVKSRKIGKAIKATFKNDTLSSEAFEAENDYYLAVIKVLKNLLLN